MLSLLYSHIIKMHIYTYTCRIHIDVIIKTSEDFFKKIYLSLYWKGCVWEGVEDRTKTALASTFSFPFSRVAQPEAQGPTLLGADFLSHILLPTSLVFKLPDFLSSLSYIIVPRLPSFCGRHNCTHSTHPRSRLYCWYFSTGCTCYLHRCISYFDSPAGS